MTGGEVGELVYSATECWDASYRVTFYEDNYSMERSGEEAPGAVRRASHGG